MIHDSNVTIQDLKNLLIEFRDERGWAKFHDPKNLAEAISIEAAELLELFLWKTPKEIESSLKSNSALKRAIHEELADVVCFSLSLANSLNVDLSKIVTSKIESNKKKYPIAKVRGIATKYDKL
jgi:dCTP diphosphatase